MSAHTIGTSLAAPTTSPMVGPTTYGSNDATDATTLRHQMLEISDLVRDLAGEFELEPLLEKVISKALGLLGYTSGSISLVDERAGT
jgi:hypothetical protein